MELNKKKAEAIKDLLTPTYFKIIEKLEKENKYLKESIKEEKIKSERNIRALNRALKEVKEDNRRLSKQIEDHINIRTKGFYL
jgi:hypothetical protein